MKGMKDIMADPAAATKDFVKAVPFWKGKEAYITGVFRYYAQLVYPSKLKQGVIDPKRLAKLQEFYVSQGIVRKKVPLDQLYTNKYVEASMK